MKVKGMNFQISGYQTAIRINVSDFGYAESEKLKFINDLLIGRIGREDLISRVTVAQQDAPAPVNLWNNDVLQDTSGRRSTTVIDCKLQGVFVGSLEALNTQTGNSQSGASVYMIPISRCEDSRPQAESRKPKLIVDSLYEQLNRKDASVVKGELHCFKKGSKLHLPPQDNSVSPTNNSHGRSNTQYDQRPTTLTHSSKSRKDVISQTGYSNHADCRRSEKRCRERRKTQSIQPGLVRRLREKFSSEDAEKSSKSSESAEFKRDSPQTNTFKSCQISNSKNQIVPTMVDTAVNTESSYLATSRNLKQKEKLFQPTYSSHPRPITKPSRRRKQENIKILGDKKMHLDDAQPIRPVNKLRRSFDVPTPSTGNSFAYQYWASDDEYDGIEYDEVGSNQNFKNFLGGEIPFDEASSSISSYASYEDCQLCSNPVKFCGDSETDTNYRYYRKMQKALERVPPDNCCCQMCIRRFKGNYASQSLYKKADSKYTNGFKNLMKTKQTNAKNNEKYKDKLKASRKASFLQRVQNEKHDQHINDSLSCPSKRHKPVCRCEQQSPGPRCVDYIEYPFSGSSTAEDYEEAEEVVRRTASTTFANRRSTKTNIIGSKPKSYSEEDSFLNFEDLKRENKNFTSLRKQFSRRLRVLESEDSDSSIVSVNQQKLAYDARVRRYTRAPPGLKNRMSLILRDETRMSSSSDTGNLSSAWGRQHSTDHKTRAPQPSGRSPKKRVNGSKINHRRRILSHIPITRNNISASAQLKADSKLIERSHQDDETEHLSSRGNREEKCRHKRTKKSLIEPSNIRIEHEPELEVTRDYSPPERRGIAEQLIAKNRNSPSELKSNVRTATNQQELVRRNSQIRDQSKLNITACTPSQEAVLSAQECPFRLYRRDWEMDNMTSKPQVPPHSGSRTTVKLNASCSKKTGI